MEQYIPHMAFGFVFMLVNVLLVLHVLDKLLIKPENRYIPKHYFCYANGEKTKKWYWIVYDTKHKRAVSSNGTSRLFEDIKSCEEYCAELEKYGVL